MYCFSLHLYVRHYSRDFVTLHEPTPERVSPLRKKKEEEKEMERERIIDAYINLLQVVGLLTSIDQFDPSFQKEKKLYTAISRFTIDESIHKKREGNTLHSGRQIRSFGNKLTVWNLPKHTHTQKWGEFRPIPKQQNQKIEYGLLYTGDDLCLSLDSLHHNRRAERDDAIKDKCQ
jgi:hypothetical protein